MSKFFQRRDLDKTFFKVLVSMLMVFVLLISVASPSHAVVGVTSILIPAVIAALESWGISTAAEGLDGDEIAEWFHDKLTSWETAAQISLANIVTGIKMTPIGQVLLNPIALAGIREFGAWLVQQEGLVAGGSSVPVIQPSSDAVYQMSAGQTVLFGAYSKAGNVSVAVTMDVGVFFYTSGGKIYYPVFVGTGPVSFSAVRYLSYNSSSSSSSLTMSPMRGSGGSIVYAAQFLSGQCKVPVNTSIPVYTQLADGLEAFASFVPSDDGSLSLVPSDEMAVPTTADIQDKEMLINTSLDVGADAAAWYEQVMNKVAANDMTATGTLVGAGTITADQVIDQGAITEQEGVVSWPDVTVPIGVSGLDEIFPFCIPFDIYHFFEALAADPVAPSFEIPFVIEGVVDYTFEIDLEPFDQVAQVLRLVELLAFCVGLAFVTRSMFIRG